MARWRWWPVLFFTLIALLPIVKPLLSGETIGAFDQIHQMAPWNGGHPAQSWDVLQADSVLQFYGWRDLVFSSWGHSQLPLWNPYQLCGTPLLANSQSAGFYPPHILVGILHIPTGIAILLLAWFHLFWAGLGTYALTRRLGSTKVGGAVAGASFCLSAFMLAWIALPSVVSTVAWIPWVLTSALALWDSKSKRDLLRPGVLLAFSTAMLLLAGHLQFAAYGLMALAVVLIWKIVAEIRLKISWIRVGVAVCAVVVGCAMASPQLLPAMAYSKLSHRQNTPSEDGYGAYIHSAIPPMQFVSRLANPFSQGVPTTPAAEGAPVSSYWPELARQGDNFAETASTVGPVVLGLLVLLPFARKSRKCLIALAPMGLIALLAFLLAVGSPLNRLLYFWVPGWSASGSPGRISVLFVLAACVLAGVAVTDQKFLDSKKLLGLCVTAFIVVALTFSIAMQTGDPVAGISANDWAVITSFAAHLNMTWIVFFALIPVAVILLLRRRIVWTVAMLAPLTGLFMLTMGLIRTGNPTDLRVVVRSSTERYAFINDFWELNSAAKGLMPPNTATLQRMVDIAGYDSLVAMSTVNLLKKVDGSDPAPPANGNMMFVKSTADPKLLAECGVTHVWSLRPLPQFGPSEPENGIYRYVLEGSGRAFTPLGKAEIELDGFDRQVISAVGPGRLSVRDRNLPGWSATVDGQNVNVSGSVWRQVELPSGSHRVVFRYTPPGLRTGFLLGAIGWLVFLGGGLLGRTRNGDSS